MKVTYYGETAGRSLAEWLNNPGTDEQARGTVLELISLGEQFNRDRTTEGRESIKNKINDILCRFDFFPIIMSHTRGGWAVNWEAHDLGLAKSVAAPIRLWLELFSIGVLPRLRRCAWKSCPKYFFSRTRGLYHSLECRTASDKANPARKERKRKYARRYYVTRLEGKRP